MVLIKGSPKVRTEPAMMPIITPQIAEGMIRAMDMTSPRFKLVSNSW
jgi:hypothetical protein